MNANYRGKLKRPINLKAVNAVNSKLYVKPRQLVIKDEKGTLILFSSGDFRVMGCVDAVEASFLAFKYVDDFPEIYSQSYTCTAKLGFPVNLYKLSQCHNTKFYPELFGAVRMTKYNPVSVNVFSTGSIVACGLKEPEHMHVILNELSNLINM